MEYINKLKQNVWKNYIFIFLSNIDLTHGTWMVYLAIKGMSLFQLGIVEGIFHITSFLMEVPTGAVADIWGRKVSRILGRISSLISIIILLFSSNFYLFALAFVFSAISYNLESGAGEALVYDSLKELNRDGTYMKVVGIQEIAMQGGKVIGFLLGGYLASKSYIYAYTVAAIFATVTVIQCFSFTEPKMEVGHEESRNVFSVIKKQVIGSLDVLKNNKKIGFLIVFSQVIFTFGTSLFFYFQNYLEGSGYTQSKIGIVLAVSSLIGAVVASQAYKIEKKIKEKGILMVMPIISAICLWGVALTEYHFVFFVIFSGVDGIIYVAMTDYINKLIPSDRRATILSFASMVFSLFMIIIFPLIGKIGDVFSLKTAFIALAILASVLVVINIYVLTTGKEVKEQKSRSGNS
ncbi:MFS transporter [Dethiothermospora halolimnae]|uniref:MFS transporter n=1 Tax=Dethiothermospora halolimnae TaxID=3114390 RepID=UPI003CCC1FD3